MYWTCLNKAFEFKQVRCYKSPDPCNLSGFIAFPRQGGRAGVSSTGAEAHGTQAICWRKDRAGPVIPGPVKFPQTFMGLLLARWWGKRGESYGEYEEKVSIWDLPPTHCVTLTSCLLSGRQFPRL